MIFMVKVLIGSKFYLSYQIAQSLELPQVSSDVGWQLLLLCFRKPDEFDQQFVGVPI
jgi:hypothetical protein